MMLHKALFGMITDYSIKEYYEEFFFKKIQEIIDYGFYYHAFALMALGVEQLGRFTYIKQHFKRKEDEPGSKTAFRRAFSVYDSLKKYKCFNTKTPVKKPTQNKKYSHNNDLFKFLRCGMAHEFRVQGCLRLTSGSSDLKRKLVGCQDFYNDLKTAWEDLKDPSRSPRCRVNLDSIIFSVDEFDSSSGSTIPGGIKTLSVK